ncbi:Uncharacterised protein [Moraxella caprae]|uniref:Uncharacterized protein n=1 Tax=Moraxella caprae TaxID=90240 RepID=A0A378R0C9_9GAMM|nr:hypothetical protein [Moraxella caprae]STZ08664.1 Uncharacterised protein [Moraxella caprae]
MSIFSKDFLAERQPTQTTAIILGTLQSFLKGKPLETGFAFENELKACRLDYTLASLQRIDDFLDNIRTTHSLDRNDFLNGGVPSNHTFLFLLAFYCGEMRGRLAGVAPIWHDYEEYIAENPQMQSIFPAIDEYRFVATYHRADNINQHFPLVAILERLFPEFDEPEKSVYFSTITGDYQAFAPDEVVQPANQSLPIDLQAACQNLSVHWQSYLQILPPKWMLGDDLMSQIKAIPTLYQKGRVVWGALVQANNMLFEEDNPASCPAEIIYDKSGRTPPHLLHELAQTLFSFKKQAPDDLPPKLKQYVQHLQNERTRFSGELPAPPTTAMSLYAKTIFVWRLHLPDAMLTLPIFPIIINDDNDEVMILPAKFWAHTEYYQKWIANPKDFIQEIVPMWANLSADEVKHFWQDYQELVVPQAEELPQFGKPNNDNPPTISSDDTRFLKRCQNKAQQEYRRWYEFFEIQTDDPELAEDLAKSKLPENLYKQLRTINLAPFLDDLKREINVSRLPNAKPLPKVATTLSQNLSPLQTAKLVQFLHTHGNTSLSKLLQNERQVGEPERPSTINTTAALALALMYLTGKNVPQTIEEGLSWLDYASKLGDSRALYWQTKLALAVPNLVPILFKDFLQKEMVDFNLVLMNEGCSPLAIEEAVEAYAENPKAQKWLARRPLQTAYEQGDKVAEQLLISYLNNGILPSQDEDKFLDVKFWVIDYLLHHKNQDYTYLISYPDADYATDEPPAWHKWAKVAGVLILMSLVKMCFFNNKNTDQPPITTAPISTQPNTVPNPTTQVIERAQSISPSDAVAQLQGTLPKKLFTGYNEITTIRQENGVVIVSLSDKNKGMMSIQSAQALYCKDQAFDLLRQSGAVVNFDILAQSGLRYKIDNVACQ